MPILFLCFLITDKLRAICCIYFSFILFILLPFPTTRTPLYIRLETFKFMILNVLLLLLIISFIVCSFQSFLYIWVNLILTKFSRHLIALTSLTNLKVMLKKNYNFAQMLMITLTINKNGLLNYLALFQVFIYICSYYTIDWLNFSNFLMKLLFNFPILMILIPSIVLFHLTFSTYLKLKQLILFLSSPYIVISILLDLIIDLTPITFSIAFSKFCIKLTKSSFFLQLFLN